MLINGDFENIGPDPANPVLVGWTAVNAAPRVRNGEPVSSFFSGNVIAVLGEPNTSQNASLCQTVPVTPGCPLRLSFAAQSNPAGPVLELQVTFNGTVFTRRLTTLGQGYNTFVYLLTPPPGATTATICFLKTGAGEAFIDNVSFGSD